MTELLYQKDSYLKEFSAVVKAVDAEKRAVLLDKTAFFPGGGGQLFDSGVIVSDDATYNLKRARKNADDVWHYLEEDDQPLPEVGTKVLGKLDWERRYKLMRTHTAMHILCGVVFRDYGAQVTGGDMEPLKGRMDFEFETMSKDLVEVIEKAVNVEVLNAHDVRVRDLAARRSLPDSRFDSNKNQLAPSTDCGNPDG